MYMDLEDHMYTVVPLRIMTNGANNWEQQNMSHILREQQQDPHQNFVFSDVRVMMTSIGIGVIAKMDIGTTKALMTKEKTLTLLLVSHVAKQVFPNLN